MYTKEEFIKLFKHGIEAFSTEDVLEIFEPQGIDELVDLINEFMLSPQIMWNSEEPAAHRPLGVHLAILNDPNPNPYLISKRDLTYATAWVYELQVDPLDIAKTKIIEVVVGRSAPSLFIL